MLVVLDSHQNQTIIPEEDVNIMCWSMSTTIQEQMTWGTYDTSFRQRVHADDISKCKCTSVICMNLLTDIRPSTSSCRWQKYIWPVCPSTISYRSNKYICHVCPSTSSCRWQKYIWPVCPSTSSCIWQKYTWRVCPSTNSYRRQ